MKLVWMGAAIAAASLGWGADSCPRWEAFPVETLTTQDRALAEEILLKAMDRESLYTIIGGIKPMSSGVLSIQIPQTEQPESRAAAIRRILPALSAGRQVSSDLLPFARLFNDRRTLDVYFFHHESFSAAVKKWPSVFTRFGVTPLSRPSTAVMAFDSDPTSWRSRAYGLLFGYPKPAVDFFVKSEDTQKADPEKKLVERDFVSIPTFERETNAFVYAVPKGYQKSAIDQSLYDRSVAVLREYRRLRPLYIGVGKPGIAALIRDWMDDGEGQCSPQTALTKALMARPE